MPTIIIGDQHVLVSKAHLTHLTQYQWHIHKTKHVLYVRGYRKGERKNGLIYMHRLILDAKSNQEVDHVNGNGLDNRKRNLRICTRSQNNANRHRLQTKTSNYKGVYFDSINRKWCADITCDGIRYRLGRHNSQKEAGQAYARKAKELFGEFANAAHSINSK